MAEKNNVNPDMLKSVFDALPSLIFVVDEDVRIQEYNAAAAGFLSAEGADVLKRRGGEALRCLHAADVKEGCGRGPLCRDCIIRNSVGEAFQGNRIVRRRARLELVRDEQKTEIYALITTSPFLYRKKQLVLLVIEDISEIAELRRLIPICSVCKRIRDDEQSWSRVENYFKEHWDVNFSHGLCPECYRKEMDKLNRDFKNRENP